MAYQPPQPPQPPPSYDLRAQYGQASYAHWGYRVLSYLIDSFVVGIPAFVGYVILGAATAASQAGNNGTVTAPPAGAVIIAIVLYLASLAFGIWNLFIRQGRTGQSLGKQAVGTRLVSQRTGQPIGGLMTFLRYLCHIVDSLPCYIGYLWPLWDPQRQTFADKIVGTVVVRT